MTSDLVTLLETMDRAEKQRAEDAARKGIAQQGIARTLEVVAPPKGARVKICCAWPVLGPEQQHVQSGMID